MTTTAKAIKVLVTGGTGRVGSRLVPRLLSWGFGVRALVRDPARPEAAALAKAGAELVPGDLKDPAAVRRALEGADAVLHLAAAFRNVPPEEVEAVNGKATTDLATAALEAGIRRFVYASTTLVYGPGVGRPITEEDPTRPTAGMAYPVAKAAAERALLELHRTQPFGLRIARLSFVYGDGDPHLAESLLWTRKWAGHQRFHMVHHADVAQALARVLSADGIDGRIYNVADDAPVTAVETFQLNRVEIPPELATRALEDPWAGIADTSRIRDELGFRPLYPTVHSARAAGAL